jgi:segregation and condensation protein B
LSRAPSSRPSRPPPRKMEDDVSEDATPDSLAARAAAWVPPWVRESAPAEPDEAEPDEAEPEPEADEPAEEPEPVEPEPEPVAEAEPEPVVVEPEPVVVDPEPVVVDPEPVAVAEPAAVEEPPDLELAEDALFHLPVPPPPVDIRPALEAILMVVDEPVTEITLAQVLEQPTERIGVELAALAQEYADQGRGFELRRAAGGWRFYTHPEQAAYVERFVLDGQSVRLTQAALETLAVVAYKQPVTRSRISAIRGVNCDGVVRTLVTRGLIEEAGTEPESGAHLYRTSTLFLEKLGLDSVEQLPPLAPFLPDDVDEIADAQRG